MDLALSPEVVSLRDGLRRFLAEHSAEDRVRQAMESDLGHDPDVWSMLGKGLDLHGLLIPVEFGGSGGTFREMLPVLEDMGAALCCGPFLSSSVITVSALLTTADEENRARLLPGLADGSTIGVLAVAERDAGWDPSRCTTRAEYRSGSWVLNGHKDFVLDGQVATTVLVTARTGDGVGMFEVSGSDLDTVRTTHPTMDLTRRITSIDLVDTPARPVGPVGAGVREALALATIALSAEQLGGAQHCLEQAVEYAKTRQQFGRPIGSFQAVKHKCADMLLRVESARSAVRYAANVAADHDEELATVASVCKVACSEAYSFAAAQNIQIHGGIGFTWEHGAHLHFKRAHGSSMLFGDPAHHRELLAAAL